MDAMEFARTIRELALRAHRMPSDGATKEELIELRGRFVDLLAAAPAGGPDVCCWIESVVERLDVQTASSTPRQSWTSTRVLNCPIQQIGAPHTFSGLPVYVHLNGFARVTLKYSMNAKILSRRSFTEVKFPRLITRRTKILNQISI